MTRKATVRTLIVVVMAAIVCGVIWAQMSSRDVTNKDRNLVVRVTGDNNNPVIIGTCQPESDLSAEGWDQDPTSGGWGGYDESTFAVAWEPDGSDNPDLVGGRMAACTIPGIPGVRPQQIIIHALEGIANDDFCVFASTGGGDVFIGCEQDDVPGEQWGDYVFELTDPKWKNTFAKGQDTTVTVLATGDGWEHRGTYGQLAVAHITIMGD